MECLIKVTVLAWDCLSIARFYGLVISALASALFSESAISFGGSRVFAMASPVLAHRICSVLARTDALGPSGSLRRTALAFDRSIVIESLMAKVLRTFGSEIPVSLATARCIVSPIF